MSDNDIKMYGYEELYKKLEIMPEKINRVINDALIKAAEPIRNEAKRKAALACGFREERGSDIGDSVAPFNFGLQFLL